MKFLILGIGLVLVIEGLVFALAPSRLDDLVRMMAEMPRDQRRLIGLIAMAIGAACLLWARSLGAIG